MSSDQMTNLLTTVLFIMIGVLCFLLIIYIVLKIKERSNQKVKEDTIGGKVKNVSSTPEKTTIEYSKKSIFSC